MVIYIGIEKNNRLFLNAIYCYDEFRGRGIATKLNNIAESLLKNFEGYLLRGVYNPTQLRKDRTHERPLEELDRRAKSFYEKNGYTIIKLEDYLKNPSMYPGVTLEDDFTFGGSLAECIVIKKITGLKNSEFIELESTYLDSEKGKRVL